MFRSFRSERHLINATGLLPSVWWIGLIPFVAAAWFWLPPVSSLVTPDKPRELGGASTLSEDDRAQTHRNQVTLQPAVQAASGLQLAGISGAEKLILPAGAPAPGAPPVGAAEEAPAAQPVMHARNAAVRSCLPALRELSQLAVDGQHVAFSTWNNVSPNDRLFQSIVGLKYENKTAPHGVAILVAAPMQSDKCDGATVQIQPSALACDKIARSLADAQLTSADLNGVRLIQASPSTRVVLIPTRGNGCAVVGIGAHYAK